METKWIKFNGLGSEIIIVANLEIGQEYLLEQAKTNVQNFENSFSRFIKKNELDNFNNFSEGKFAASELFVQLIRDSQSLHAETKGIFDPTIISSLEKIGYNKSFTEIVSTNGVPTEVQAISRDFSNRTKLSELRIDGNTVEKPVGLRIDFGGIGKGFLADYLSDNLFKFVENFWISLGGDIVIKGHQKDDEKKGWKVGVQDPNEPATEIFSIKTGGKKLGIATSGIFKRQGVNGGVSWHHIIDPRTGLPVENNIIAATVISSSAKRADVFAKTVLILGEKQGLELIERENDSAAILFFKGGGAAFSKRAPQYL